MQQVVRTCRATTNDFSELRRKFVHKPSDSMYNSRAKPLVLNFGAYVFHIACTMRSVIYSSSAFRELVITGCSLNLFFSYYRIQPLWISIKWNALFLAINAALLGLMWKEQQDAEELGEDPEQVKHGKTLPLSHLSACVCL